MSEAKQQEAFKRICETWQGAAGNAIREDGFQPDVDYLKLAAHQPAAAPVAGAELRAKADKAYRFYLGQMRRDECLGYEEKLKLGKFGKKELDAHTRAAELLGRHRAFMEAAALTPSPVAPSVGGTVGLDGDTQRDWSTDGPAWEKRALEAEERLAPVATEETQRLRELLREKIILMGLNHNKKFNGDLHEPDSCTICDVLRAEAALGQLPEGK